MFDKAPRRWPRCGTAARTLLLFVPAAVVVSGCLAAAVRTQAGETRANAGGTPPANTGRLLTGRDALGDWTTDAPGVRRKITTRDLPKPYDTPSVDNGPRIVRRPENAWPQAPRGFRVEQFATGLTNPRVIVTAPNGDLFVAESGANRIKVLRDADGDGKPETVQVFADGLKRPFGIAFYPTRDAYPNYIYVANTDGVVRYRYRNGDLKARGEAQEIVGVSGGGQLRGGGHWTRDIDFSRDGRRMLVSVGSLSNVSDDEKSSAAPASCRSRPRARTKSSSRPGIRNPVGLAIHPVTGQVWTSVNERDGLGDHLVPDYITSVREGGFYGWPWYYIGPYQDPRHPGKKPELRNRVIVPDVLVQSHSASLDLCFYTGRQFPREYQNHIFAAEHGSWNRARRTGYKVVRVPLDSRGRPTTGEYQDFLTGFVTPDGDVWGRPVGVTTGRDGALFVTDDGGNCVWRVVYGAATRNGRQADAAAR
jgi:glucose/arabinose dehydrogenase